MSGADVTEAAAPASVPAIPLEKAIEAVQSAGPYGVRHPRSAFAQHLGHKSDNGAFRQKLAALRDFGLVKRQRDGDVELTELGMRLAVPLSEEAARRDRQEAFFQSALFAGMYDAMAKGVSLDVSAIGATAYHKYRLAGAARETLSQVFVSSARTASLIIDEADGRIRLVARELSVEPSGIDPEVSITDNSAAAGADPVPATTASQGSATKPLATDLTIRRSLPGGHAVFAVKSTSPMPARAFGLLQSLTEAIDQLTAEFRTEESSEENL